MAELLDQDDIDNLLNAAKEGNLLGGNASEEDIAGAKKLELDKFSPPPEDTEVDEQEQLDKISLLDDVTLDVKVELGRTIMPIEEILKLKEGSIVELNKLAGDPVDILVNGKLVARGEVLVLNENFSIRVTEIVSPQDRINFEKMGES